MQTGCRLELHVVQVMQSSAMIQLHLTQWFGLVDMESAEWAGIGSITILKLFITRQYTYTKII